MAGRVDAYVDTSALIAFADASDTYHPVFRRMFAAPPSVVVTTSLVITEGHGFLQRFDRVRARQFLAMIDGMPFLEVRPVGAHDLAAAAPSLRRFTDQDLTMVDVVGLHLMLEGTVVSCWSTHPPPRADGHAAGDPRAVRRSCGMFGVNRCGAAWCGDGARPARAC